MLAAFQDWQVGHSPVTTGRAQWLPAPFIQAMHVARNVIREQEAAARRKAVNRGRA